MINIELNQFWEQLEASNLLSGMDLDSMKSRVEGFNHPPEKAARRVARWLAEQNLITAHQSQVLLAGHPGPFQYGNYLIQEPVGEDNPFVFSAIHQATRFPVWLHFFPGQSHTDLAVWNEIESLTGDASQVRHPSLVSVFESVVTPTHRFVVTNIPMVSRMAEKLPRKSRLPWKKTGSIMSRVAAGVAAMHEGGYAHGNLSMETIWIGGEAKAQVLAPVSNSTIAATPESTVESVDDQADKNNETAVGDLTAFTKDVADLGRLMFRIITGRPLEGSEEILDLSREKFAKALDRFELPSKMSELLFESLHLDTSSEPKLTAATFRDSLLAVTEDKIDKRYKAAAPERDFQQRIDQWGPKLREDLVESVPSIDTQSETDLVEQAQRMAGAAPDKAEKIQAAISAATLKKDSKWKIPATIAASLAVFTAALVGWAVFANQKMVDKRTIRIADNSLENANSTETLNDNRQSGPAELEGAPTKKNWLLQNLIPDDNQTLWESPTTGPRVALDYLPNAPQLIAIINWDKLLASGEGSLIVDAMGPDFRTRLSAFETRAGFTIDQLESTTVSLHSTEQLTYEPFAVVTLKTPLALEQCLSNWQQPVATPLTRDQVVYVKNELAYWPIDESGFLDLPHAEIEQGGTDDLENTDSEPEPSAEASSEPNPKTKLVQRFAVGPKSWVTLVANGETTIVGGALNRLAMSADETRHVNLFFLRPGLFNDEGKALMGRWSTLLQPEMRLLIPDEVRAGLLSFHVDNGNYIELKLDHVSEIKSDKLVKQFRSQLEDQRESIGKFVLELSSNSYWDPIRLRFDRMLSSLTRQWRWDVEFDNVVANAWLPPMATHNLIAGSELALTYGKSQVAPLASTTAEKLPQDLAELLTKKRSLKITNPPDLNVLLTDIESEVRDQYLQLPFEFNIRLMGNDLRKEGITQNQRPGELNIVDQSLADILTSVMASANPNRNISGPSDPDCKLVWVVAQDPENESQQAVLVTTRKAAVANGYELPAAFVAE